MSSMAGVCNHDRTATAAGTDLPTRRKRLRVALRTRRPENRQKGRWGAMQLVTRIYFAALAVLGGCGNSEAGSGVPGSPDSSTTPPSDVDIHPDSGGTPGTDGGECSTNVECTDRATKAARSAGKSP